MRKTLFFSTIGGALLLLVILSVQLSAAAEEGKMSVAVVEFDSMGNLGIKDAGSIVAEWMISAVGRTEKFDLKERVLLKKVLDEQKLALSGVVDDQKIAARIGKLYGVESVITGGIIKWGNTISVTARLIDTTTGSILKTADIKTDSIDAVPELLDRLAAVIAGANLTMREGKFYNFDSAGNADENAAEKKSRPETITPRPDDPQPGALWREPVTGMEFVWIPSGCYTMGQHKQTKRKLIAGLGKRKYELNYDDENPRHNVCVDGLWVGRFEVTNRQFRLFDQKHDSREYNGMTLDGDDQPAVYVSWQQADAFAAWLSSRNDGSYRFRLPSEAEWEYGCRAGSDTPRFWGFESDDACKYANVHDRMSAATNKFFWTHHDCDDGYAVTAPVGRYYPNAFGLHDMLGNVWEWTGDIYVSDAYYKHSVTNPVIEQGGINRVRRGGAWNKQPASVRCANRGNRAEDARNKRIGFRLVMEEQRAVSVPRTAH